MTCNSVLDIGPAFEVSALGNANLDAQANFGITLAYNVDGAKLTFPPSVGSSSGSFSPGDMCKYLSSMYRSQRTIDPDFVAVSVAATPNVAVDGDIEAHLIPAATFGINAFDGDAQANINLSLDTSGKLTLSLKAGSLDTGSAGTAGKSGAASGSFSGCAEIDAGLAVTGGADAHLFDIFDKSVSVTLFQKNFNVLDVRNVNHDFNNLTNMTILPTYRNVSVALGLRKGIYSRRSASTSATSRSEA